MLNRPTMHDVLTAHFPEHAGHSVTKWDAQPMDHKRRAGDKRVQLTCSCGGHMTLLAIGQVYDRVRVGLRNVWTLSA